MGLTAPGALAALTGVFVGSVVVSNLVAGKLLSIGMLVFPAGTLAYPITFLVTDSVGEVWGPKAANRVVIAGTVGLIVAAIISWAVSILPGVDPEGAYETVFGIVPRVAFASLIAFMASQFLDVRLFHVIRKQTGSGHLWLRNNGSTIISQGVDAALFVTIAFAGIIEASTLIKIIGSQYAAKIMIAILDTPLCYALVHFMRRTPLHAEV